MFLMIRKPVIGSRLRRLPETVMSFANHDDALTYIDENPGILREFALMDYVNPPTIILPDEIPDNNACRELYVKAFGDRELKPSDYIRLRLYLQWILNDKDQPFDWMEGLYLAPLKIGKNQSLDELKFIKVNYEGGWKDREAISFNDDGFIGFAGWAAGKNATPMLAAFAYWCNRELRSK